MQVTREKEALYISCEMEKRAILLYERAMEIVGDKAVLETLSFMLSQEREHLKVFSCMYADCEDHAPLDETALTLAAEAAQVLFPGGLMQFSRNNALSSPEALLRFASDSERTAIGCYTEFAECCTSDGAKKRFLAIAKEERNHLEALQYQLLEWVQAANPKPENTGNV